MLSPLGLLSYDIGIPIAESGDATYLDKRVHMNMTSEAGTKPILDKEDTYLHILVVVMAQQFSLRAGLKNFGNERRKAVSKNLTQLNDKIAYVTLILTN